jgi:hypothetical protein
MWIRTTGTVIYKKIQAAVIYSEEDSCDGASSYGERERTIKYDIIDVLNGYLSRFRLIGSTTLFRELNDLRPDFLCYSQPVRIDYS